MRKREIASKVNKIVNEDRFHSMTVRYSRHQPLQEQETYYRFTEDELKDFVKNIVDQCAQVADYNHDIYCKYAEALSNKMLAVNSGDLIRQYWELNE
jgi:hypothetical protein